jgi:post-segregation antitoxin (ccd killing protein)
MANRETIEIEINTELLNEAQELGLDIDAIVEERLTREIKDAKAAQFEEKKESP